MLFRQRFERKSCTYTDRLAPRVGGEALLIDPVKTELGKYLQLIDELDLRECLSRKFSDGERIAVGGLELRALYTPGHSDDSYVAVPANLARGAT